jgi:hypothetical protein
MYLKSTKLKSLKSNISEKFMDLETYQLMEEITREYIEGYLDMSVVLYQIDRETSNPDAIYHESSTNNTTYKEPVELKVMYRIAESTSVVLNPSNGSVQQKLPGNLTFPIFESQLEETNCDIENGDLIAVPVTSDRYEFFVVSDDGRANVDNLHSSYGYHKRTRSIVAVWEDPTKLGLELYNE